MTTTFTVSFEVDEKIEFQTDFIRDFLVEWMSFLSESGIDFGVEYVGVKAILMESVEGYQDFFKPGKPTYKKTFTIKNPIHGDKTYNGGYVFDYKFSEQAYGLLAEDNKADFVKTMKLEVRNFVDKLELLAKKSQGLCLEEIKVRTLQYYDNELSKLCLQ